MVNGKRWKLDEGIFSKEKIRDKEVTKDKLIDTFSMDEISWSENLYNDMTKNFERIRERNTSSTIPYPNNLNEILKNSKLNDTDRISYSEKLLWVQLTEKQKSAIIDAHQIGLWKYVPFSSIKNNDNYRNILKQKRKVLKDSWLSKEQTEQLFDHCICLWVLQIVLSFSAACVAIVAIWWFWVYRRAQGKLNKLLESDKYSSHKNEIKLFMNYMADLEESTSLENKDRFLSGEEKVKWPSDDFFDMGLQNKVMRTFIPKKFHDSKFDAENSDSINQALKRYEANIDYDGEKTALIKEFIKDLGYNIHLLSMIANFQKLFMALKDG